MNEILLLIAGVVGGMLNSIAGGGSFITFPALLLAGVPPIAANATNTFASCSGYLSGVYAFRQDLATRRAVLRRYVFTSLLGGGLGAWLLLQTPEHVFRDAVPWLLLFATLLFIWGGALNRRLSALASGHRHASSLGAVLLGLFLLLICTYGGFFNAGLGIVTLSYLALAGEQDINLMNGIKLLVSAVVSLVAIVLFVIDGVIVWREGVIVLLGTLIGGYLAAHYSRQLPQRWVRRMIIVASIGITGYFFFDTYYA